MDLLDEEMKFPTASAVHFTNEVHQRNNKHFRLAVRMNFGCSQATFQYSVKLGLQVLAEFFELLVEFSRSTGFLSGGIISEYIKFQASSRRSTWIFRIIALWGIYSLWSNDLVVKALDCQSRVPVFKTTGWLQGRLSLSSFRGR